MLLASSPVDVSPPHSLIQRFPVDFDFLCISDPCLPCLLIEEDHHYDTTAGMPTIAHLMCLPDENLIPFIQPPLGPHCHRITGEQELDRGQEKKVKGECVREKEEGECCIFCLNS